MKKEFIVLSLAALLLLSFPIMTTAQPTTSPMQDDDLSIEIRKATGLPLGFEIVFTNEGDETITDISWSRTTSAPSGIVLLNAEAEGDIGSLAPDEEEIVQCSPIGLGTIIITVDVEYDMVSLRSEATGFLLLPFVFGITSIDDLLTLDIRGLTNLGADAVYEGWIIIDDNAISTGRFNVDLQGDMRRNTFFVNKQNLADAETFVLTIEPVPDTDPGPSDTHILAGDFDGDQADLTVDHPSALGTEFTDATGEYILATPSTTTTTDELSGVWFLNPNDGSPIPGLDLPELPDGWQYEGWAVIDDIPVSTGTFLDVAAADDSDFYSGPEDTPSFPGEDFIQSAPIGLTFPTSLEDQQIVISVEPYPDYELLPFVLKPLTAMVPNPASDHTVYSMDNNAVATNPTGEAERGEI